MGFLGRFAQRYLMLRSLTPMAERALKPVVDRLKEQMHRLLAALALVSVGVACVVAGLGYFASSLWHALEPVLGTVGADIILGAGYWLIAVAAIVTGLRFVRN